MAFNLYFSTTNIYLPTFPGNDIYTALLVHGNSATDVSLTTQKTLTPFNLFFDSSVPPGIGTSSFRFPLGSYIDVQSHSDFNMGTGDWTIDLWAKKNSPGHRYWFGNLDLSQMISYSHNITSRAAVYLTGAGPGWPTLEGATNITDGQWHHIAVCRSGTTVYLFVDGNIDGTLSIGAGYVVNFNIPRICIPNGAGEQFQTEIRVSKGIARWTAPFTPPTSAYI